MPNNTYSPLIVKQFRENWIDRLKALDWATGFSLTRHFVQQNEDFHDRLKRVRPFRFPGSRNFSYDYALGALYLKGARYHLDRGDINSALNYLFAYPMYALAKSHRTRTYNTYCEFFDNLALTILDTLVKIYMERYRQEVKKEQNKKAAGV